MGDLDGDGNVDLVVAGSDANFDATTTVYLGDGSGGFSEAGAGLTDVKGSSTSIGDVNEDGDLDLVVTGRNANGSPTTTVYLGDGTGNFSEAGAGLTGVAFGSTSVGDFNEDGNLDLVVSGTDADFESVLKVYLGDGSGSFSEAGAGLKGDVATAVGDVNGDGHLDLAVSGSGADGDPTTKVYLGDGTGNFNGAGAGLPGLVKSSISLGDLDADGNLDLVVTGEDANGDQNAKVYLGDGSGGFSEANAGLTGVEEGSTSLGDLDGDGNLDVVVTGEDANDNPTATAYLGDGSGEVTAAGAGLTGVKSGSSSLGDVDGDGHLDLLLTGRGDTDRNAIVYENLSSGSLLTGAASETVSGDGRVEFSGTGIAIDFSGTSGSGTVMVQKYSDRPNVPLGIGTENVSEYRYVLSAGGDLSFGDATEIRLDVSTLDGVEDAPNVTLYTRPARDVGVFEMLSTSFDSGANELVAQTGSFSEFALGSGSEPLPVELASFEAALEEEAARLTWETASETGNAGFEVQRRAGSEGPWTDVGFVESGAEGGTTEEPRSYRFVDENLPFEADTMAYRLQQVDLDGTKSVTEAVTVGRGAEQLTLREVFPNPAHGQATVRYAVPERQKIRLGLYDVLGRKVRTIRNGTAEGRQELQVGLSALAGGTYLLRLQAGRQAQTRRLIVVR
ncbi:MAG: T9SS type A sorting domain-containing protein [Salinivenus sp.]